MKIAMTADVVKETFGKVLLIGINQRFEYNQEKREYTDVVQSTTINLGCEKMEDSFSVQVETSEIPNVKKWGEVAFDGLTYEPYATVNSYERDGKTRNSGVLNERFKCVGIKAATPADKRADENGEVVPKGKNN